MLFIANEDDGPNPQQCEQRPNDALYQVTGMEMIHEQIDACGLRQR
jgi:hypothetical protein